MEHLPPATRSPTCGIVFRVCPLLSAAIVMTSLTFRAPAAAEFNGINDPITTVGISLEIVPDSPSKRSTSITLVFSPEPLVQLSLVQAISIGIFHATSIAVYGGLAPA